MFLKIIIILVLVVSLGLFSKVATDETASPTIQEIDVVTPKSTLPTPKLLKDEEKKVLYIELPKINHGAIDQNDIVYNNDIKYQVYIRRLERVDAKDKHFALGKKILFFDKSHKYNLNVEDKGIYSVRYRVIITKGDRQRRTMWSQREVAEFR